LASAQTIGDIRARKVSDETMTKIRKVVLALLVRILEEPHDVRDLMVRLQLRPEWLACAGLAEEDLDDPDRFDEAVLQFLVDALRIDRKTVADLQRKIHAGQEAAKGELLAYLDRKLRAVQDETQACVKSGQGSSNVACRRLAARFAQCPLFSVSDQPMYTPPTAPLVNPMQTVPFQTAPFQFKPRTTRFGGYFGGYFPYPIVTRPFPSSHYVKR
jgi:hypothetical protein